MRKTIVISILFVTLIMLTLTGVQAASASTLANDLYSKLSAYGVTAADRVKIERYVSSNNVTDEQATEILAKADEAVAIMKEAGVTDVTKLSSTDKTKIQNIAQSAANVVGLTLNFKSGSVEVYDSNGKLIETITSVNGKLAYTGNTVNTGVVVSSVAVIALAVAIITRKAIAK